jgi:two-component system, cell cycle response regulator
MGNSRLPGAISNQERVLVVDDDALLLDTLQQGLSLRGYLCETAIDAATALRHINKKYFHSMVIDITLPDMNGLQLTEKVKKLNPDIAVIIMTGFINEFSYQDAMEARAADFIRKPFGLQELIARLEYATMHEKLYRISLHDDLTGLYNRRGFFTLAEHLLKQAKREQDGLFMLYADLDDLKGINDTLGHQKGDWALIDAGNVLKKNFRDSDIIARIGGDEFGVMPIGKSGDNVELIINRFQKAVEMDNLKSKREYKLSISTGIAYFDSLSPCTIDELLSQADKSMYEHKKGKQAA